MTVKSQSKINFDFIFSLLRVIELIKVKPSRRRISQYSAAENLINTAASEGLMSLDTDGLSNGVYLVQVTSGNKQMTKKITVQK